MSKRQCMSCGTEDGMSHFRDRCLTANYKHFSRPVHNLAGWECRACGEIIFDKDTDSAERYVDAGDRLLEDSLRLIGAEMKRIRLKLHLTQRNAVRLLSGGGHNAFSRYERGELSPPQPLFTLMQLLDRHPHLLGDVQEVNQGNDLKQLMAARHPEQEPVLTS